MVDMLRERGDTWDAVATFTRSDGSARDITGCTFLLTVNKVARPTDTADQLFESTGSILGDPLNGQASFPVVIIPPGKYFYNIQLTEADGITVRTPLSGAYVVLQDITKSDEEFIWTASATPSDGDPVATDGTEFWKKTTYNASDVLTYETRDARRVVRWSMDMDENSWQGRDLMALGPESPRPSNLWYPTGWEFKVTAYCHLSRTGLLFVTLGFADYIDLVVDNNDGSLSAGWSAFVEGESDANSGPTDDASWVTPDWYVFGLRIDSDGVPWGILHPETEVGDYGIRDWTKIMPDGWTWNPVVPFSIQFGAKFVDPNDPAAVCDLWKYEWRRL